MTLGSATAIFALPSTEIPIASSKSSQKSAKRALRRPKFTLTVAVGRIA
jgi:hypothetical protein